MPSVHLQLHATPSELLTLVQNWADDHRLGVGLQVFRPRRRAVMGGEDVIAESAQIGGAKRVLLSRRIDGVQVAANGQSLAGADQSCLIVEIGDLSAYSLRESAIGVVGAAPEDLRLWRHLLKDVKQSSHKGASVVNPGSGARQAYATHYHTVGAHDLASQGFSMLAIAGTNVFVFDDLQL